MAKVFELYGRPMSDWAEINPPLDANCPYQDQVCDGGGNRDMASMNLENDSAIRSRFVSRIIRRGSVSCSICSVNSNDRNWIICPRRLLSLTDTGVPERHKSLIRHICRLSGFKTGDLVSIWSEVRVAAGKGSSKFNYRFDYILRKNDGDKLGPPIIVEVMTCSTSGGNKKHGTDMTTACRKAILQIGISKQSDLKCPSVNVPQVWARMLSQLVVKSEAALRWDGKTIWIIQDHLAEYINDTTGLNLSEFEASELDEINILACDMEGKKKPVLYAGKINSGSLTNKSFADILRAPFLPKLNWEKVTGDPLCQFIVD